MTEIKKIPSKENKNRKTNDKQIIAKGKGDTDYICGKCEQTICENIGKDQIKNLTLECPKCGEPNMCA